MIKVYPFTSLHDDSSSGGGGGKRCSSISPSEVSGYWAWVVACVLGGCVGMLDGSSSKLGGAADDDSSKLGGGADDSPVELGDTTEDSPGKLGGAVDGSLAHLLDLIASIHAFRARFLRQLLLSEAIGVASEDSIVCVSID